MAKPEGSRPSEALRRVPDHAAHGQEGRSSEHPCFDAGGARASGRRNRAAVLAPGPSTSSRERDAHGYPTRAFYLSTHTEAAASSRSMTLSKMTNS
jgi:hypothetical protein